MLPAYRVSVTGLQSWLALLLGCGLQVVSANQVVVTSPPAAGKVYDIPDALCSIPLDSLGHCNGTVTPQILTSDIMIDMPGVTVSSNDSVLVTLPGPNLNTAFIGMDVTGIWTWSVTDYDPGGSGLPAPLGWSGNNFIGWQMYLTVDAAELSSAALSALAGSTAGGWRQRGRRARSRPA